MKRKIMIVIGIIGLLIVLGVIGTGVFSVKYVLLREENASDEFGENKVTLTASDGIQLAAFETISAKKNASVGNTCSFLQNGTQFYESICPRVSEARI